MIPGARTRAARPPARAKGPVVKKRALLLLAGSLVVSAALAGCSSDDKPDLAYQEQPVEELYNAAVEKMTDGLYLDAAVRFDEVERQHPYSIWARRAMLMSAFSYYQSNKYDEAILAADRFITLHPGNRDAPYAYYLKGVCYYEQITDVGRDQRMTQQALDALNEVVRRFPNSEYARDARLKIDMTRDHLAGKEMEIGRYYLRRNQLVAAINRFRNVIEKYQTTTHTPEALHRLVEAYLSLGVTQEAQTAAAVLGYNYPGSEWYADSYELLTKSNLRPEENKDSWISRAWNSVF
ncbi:MAG: outer membrane protein assembly factor BamD [Alphaproteobacteria bacterium]|nr:outer membrane protein assembly factor BamD [Alphaproteobacteria bacterium]